MNGKKWIRSWLLFVLLIPLLAAFNYVVDPYGVNHLITLEGMNAKKNSNATLTTRVKANSLEEGDFTTIMLGTSKMGVMDPTIVDAYLGGKTFNFAYPGSTTEIQNKLFFYALKYNKIKNLVYGIDLMSFNKNRTIQYDFQEFCELEEKIDKQASISNYDLYFNLDTLMKSITLVYNNVMGKMKTHVIYTKHGMRKHSNYIESFANGSYVYEKEFIKEMKHYYLPGGMYKKYDFSTAHLKSFRDIIVFCKKNNINVWVYIPPTHSDFFNALVPAGHYDAFELFKNELVSITNFTDFSGNNVFNKDTNHYWDGIHLKEGLTEVIMSNIFNQKSKDAPMNFGTYVTTKNIETHLKNLRKEIVFYDLNQTLYTNDGDK